MQIRWPVTSHCRQNDVKSQKKWNISEDFFCIELKICTVMLTTKFHEMSTVTFPWQHNGLQALSIQKVKSEFSSFKKWSDRKLFFQQERLDSLKKLWELLLSKSAEKGRMLLFTQKRVHFLHETEEVMSWIVEKASYQYLNVIGNNKHYYMASTASRQDEPNPVLWLATWAGKMEWYCPLRIAHFVPAITFRQSPSGCTKVFFRKIFSMTVKRFSVISLSKWN